MLVNVEIRERLRDCLTDPGHLGTHGPCEDVEGSICKPVRNNSPVRLHHHSDCVGG